MNILEMVLIACEKVVYKFEHNENDILSKAGTVFGIGAVVAACVATHKSEKLIRETKEKVNALAEKYDEEESDNKQITTEITKEVVKTGAKEVFYFGIVGGLEAASIYFFNESKDYHKENAAMWMTIAGGYADRLLRMRKSVAGKIGKEAEEELYYGVEKKNVPVIEDGKTKKKKVRAIVQDPVNHNVLCFAPWTSELYTDEDMLGCPGVNRDRIRGTFKTLNTQLQYSRNRYVSTNDIADMFHIQNSAEWYTEGIVAGEGILQYTIREVYEMYEGRYIPIYYIEVNCTPFLQDRLSAVLPDAPVYE